MTRAGLTFPDQYNRDLQSAIVDRAPERFRSHAMLGPRSEVQGPRLNAFVFPYRRGVLGHKHIWVVSCEGTLWIERAIMCTTFFIELRPGPQLALSMHDHAPHQVVHCMAQQVCGGEAGRPMLSFIQVLGRCTLRTGSTTRWTPPSLTRSTGPGRIGHLLHEAQDILLVEK